MKKIVIGVVLLVLPRFLPLPPLVGLIGLVLMLWGVISIAVQSGKTAALRASGAAHSFSHGGTAIAIYPDKQVLLLKQGSKSKEYAFPDIRGWETNTQSGGEIIATGWAGATTLGHNIRTARGNKSASGLFVQVRDIDNPVWRINMLRKTDQQRWMEILRQTINND